jgi:sec-independent protein translocase protein TatB
MSLGDSIFIFGLALVIFGPKKLPEIGRQLGKLVLEFRRASNEFKMQIEEELRAAEVADRQKQIAAPVTPAPDTPAPDTPAPAPEPTSDPLTIRPPSNGTTVSTESPSSRVIPVDEEVAELEAVAGDHPELASNGIKREPEQAVTHHD